MNLSLILFLLIGFVVAAPSADRMKQIPGYPDNYSTAIYTGYLDLGTKQKAAHYVFVESVKGANNNDPVTLWLNGGPGCSSLIGFLQQIGPYYLPEGQNYNYGDNLTLNQYSWHRVSNLLFLESPTGVGYSYNTDTTFIHTDASTAQDNLAALLDFYKLFPEYRNNRFWIAGQSYAGKYIPDLGVLIDKYNLDTANKINFKGIIVGNGIMNLVNTRKSQVKYMMDRSFVDPEITSYWNSCQLDPDSAGCRYFMIKFSQSIQEINPFSVYDYCFYNDSLIKQDEEEKEFLTQQSILLNLKRSFDNQIKADFHPVMPCTFSKGLFNYFNLNQIEYRAKFPNQLWNGPCASNLTYHPDPKGSLDSYRYLLARSFDVNYQIHLYNGNWDVVVPYHDTIENIRALHLVQSYLYIPWFTQKQHSGFHQIYSGILFTIVKGASHMVPMSKRAQALQLFNNTLEGHKDLYAKQKQWKMLYQQ